MRGVELVLETFLLNSRQIAALLRTSKSSPTLSKKLAITPNRDFGKSDLLRSGQLLPGTLSESSEP
jgi:hypothetical protein